SIDRADRAFRGPEGSLQALVTGQQHTVLLIAAGIDPAKIDRIAIDSDLRGRRSGNPCGVRRRQDDFRLGLTMIQSMRMDGPFPYSTEPSEACLQSLRFHGGVHIKRPGCRKEQRSEEHTSELQSRV